MTNTISLARPPVLPEQPTFAPAFFQRYAAEQESRQAAPNAPEKWAPLGISYIGERYESHSEFCASPEFRRYRDEVTWRLNGLEGFCRRNQMKDADVIARNFQTFFSHRFEQSWFDTQAELVDGAGKQSLDRFCQMVHDDSFPLEARKAAVRNLSEGVAHCASGAVANLIEAERELFFSMGAIKAAIWKIKGDTVRGVLQEAVTAKYGNERGFEGSEIHYVNAVWNHIADAMGLQEIPDLTTPALDEEFLDACRQKVLSGLTPDRIADTMAEQCMASFSSQAAASGIPLFGPWTPEVSARFSAIAKKIYAEWGIEAGPQLLHRFLRSDHNDGSYAVRSDVSLIEWDLLRTMDANHLLGTAISNRGSWTDETGGRVSLYTCGGRLAWAVSEAGEGSVGPNWDAEPDVPTLTDLFAWSKAQVAAGRPDVPPSGPIARAVAAAGLADLLRVPAHWMHDTALLLALFGRLDDGTLQRYLQANLAYFQNGFPPQGRGVVIDHVIGRADIALKLVRDWYPDPWVLLGESESANGDSRLHRWVMQDNATAIDAIVRIVRDSRLAGEHDVPTPIFTAYSVVRGGKQSRILGAAMAGSKEAGIDAWHRLVVSVAPLERLWVANLLNPGDGNVSPLNAAMRTKHPGGVRAFHRLLTDPLIRQYIGVEDLRTMVTCFSDSCGSALYGGLVHGSPAAVNAYTALLVDPTIFRHIKPDLLKLIRAEHGGIPALNKMLEVQRADAIDAYCAMLTHPVITPEIADQLPSIVAAKNCENKPGLVFAMQIGHAAAVQRYHALLTHPAIVPHIVRGLPDLVAAKTPRGTAAFTVAMQQGRVAAVKAYHALLIDPAILPHVQNELPDLLEAKNPDGNPALWLAARRGHVAAIEAFHAMLADPLVLPHIVSRLPGLLAAKGASGSTALAEAFEALHVGAVSAYYAILADPNITRHLGQRMVELMQPFSTPQTAPTREPPVSPPLATSRVAPAAARERPRRNRMRRLLQFFR